jgi:hypothetical protein
MRTLPRVVTGVGGIGETGLAGSGGRRVLRGQSGRRSGVPDPARASGLAWPAIRNAATPARCLRAGVAGMPHGGGVKGYGWEMAAPVVSQTLPDQTLPVPVVA